jgi:uncharacterized protein (DUF58 family)
MTPSRRLLSILVFTLPIAALPVVVHPSLWVLTGGMWLALLIGALIDARSLWPARVSIRATLARSVGVGDDLSVPIEVELRGRRPVTALLRAEVEAPLVAGDDVSAVLAPGATRHQLGLHAPRRGRGKMLATWVKLRGPLRLLDRIERVALLDAEVSVLPNVRRVRDFALEHFGLAGYQGSIHVGRSFGGGSELDSLSAYAQGMDLRSVDWKATARHQALMVRRYRPERNQRVIVCLDTGRLMGDPIDGLERLDHAIHAGLFVSHTALRGGDLVGLFAYADEPACWLPPASGLRHLERVTQASARLSVQTAETNHFLGLRDLMGKLGRRSLMIVFTEFTDATSAEIMIENLAQVAQKHLVLFVALDDPVIEVPLASRPDQLDAAARAVVAAGLREDRRRVLARLGRAGVDVVHGPPHRATLDLVSHYVRIKRRGLIG